jgi:hypothetical protein
MATLLLAAAGGALGGMLGGVGAMIGQAVGGIAGALVDQALLRSGSRPPARVSPISTFRARPRAIPSPASTAASASPVR